MKLLEQNYGIDQIVHVEWHISQSFNNPDAQLVRSLYGISATPTVEFDGGYQGAEVIGGGVNMYPYYEPFFLQHRAEQSKLMIDSQVLFDADPNGTGSITIDLEIAPGELIGAAHTVKVAIYEDDINAAGSNWDKIGRSLPVQIPMTIVNGGETQTINESFPMDPFNQGWNPANLHAIVYVQRNNNNKIIQSDLATPMTATDVTPLVASGSVTLELWQNAPNPVRTTTSIDFALPRAEAVDLRVYDVAGRVVRTLSQGTRPAGPHRISWNGKDESGRDVPAGVYFYRLATPEKVLARSLTLIR